MDNNMNYLKGEILLGYSLGDAKNIKQVIPVNLPFINNETERNIKIEYVTDPKISGLESDLGSQILDDGRLPRTSYFSLKVNNLNKNFVPLELTFLFKNFDNIDNVNEIYDSKSFNFLNVFNSQTIQSDITINNESASLRILNLGTFMVQLTSAGSKSQFLTIASTSSQKSKKRNKNDVIIIGKIVILYTMNNEPKTEAFVERSNRNLIGV
jgi:hypothetical protein